MTTPPQTLRSAELSSGRFQTYFILAVIFVAALTFAESLGFGFVYDDVGQIVENPHILSARELPGYFTHPVTVNFYRPLFMLWLFVNRMLFGLNPVGWHFASILLHVVASVLLFLVARRVLKDDAGALFAALIFATHPTKIEAVSWISGITEPMMAVFVFASLYAFIRSREGSRAWTVLAPMAAAGAMLSKETGVVIVPLIFAYMLLVAEPGRVMSALKTASPFVLIAAAYLIVRKSMIGGLSQSQPSLLIAEMVLTWPKTLLFYLGHQVWPADLAVYYDFQPVRNLAARDFAVPLSIVVLLSGAVLVVAHKFKERSWLFGWVWFVVALTPVLYLRVFSMNDFVHDRYLYLPSAGLAIATAVVFVAWRESSKFAVPAAAGMVVLLLFATTAQQLFWKNNLALFSRASAISPGNEYVLNNLAVEMEKQGDYERAVSLYRAAVAKNPRLWTAQFNLGIFLLRTGALAEADQHLAASLEVNSRYAPALANRALVKMHQGDFQSALRLAQSAVDLAPENADYIANLGTVKQAAGDIAGAREAFDRALRLDPDNAAVREAMRALPQK